MNQQELKILVAKSALKLVEADSILGIGSGSTVNCFIDELATIKSKVKACVCASNESEKRLRAHGFDILNPNEVSSLDLYIDGADEITPHKAMIKGGGAALTREKIIASISKSFICIVDSSKQVDLLGQKFPLPVEVIPAARSYVARELVKLGASPELRENVVTDNGNVILDLYNFPIYQPLEMEQKINNITGVVTNGIFAKNPASKVFVAHKDGRIDIL